MFAADTMGRKHVALLFLLGVSTANGDCYIDYIDSLCYGSSCCMSYDPTMQCPDCGSSPVQSNPVPVPVPVSVTCNAGYYVYNGGCSVCGPGTYQPYNGFTGNSCQACSPGWYAQTGWTSCGSCWPGTYSAYWGSEQCYSVPAGYYQSDWGQSGYVV